MARGARPIKTEVEGLAAVRRQLLQEDRATGGARRRKTPTIEPLDADVSRAIDLLRLEGERETHSREMLDLIERARVRVRGGDRELHAAFWPVIGTPPDCGPAEIATARVYWRRILDALDEGTWTHSERVMLRKLEKVWGRRARGEDMRFILVGNKPGRLDRATEQRIRQLEGRPMKGDIDE